MELVDTFHPVKDRRMTAGEFLAQYADRSGIDPDVLLAHGRVVATCSCGDTICDGWQLVPEDCLLPWRQETVALRG